MAAALWAFWLEPRRLVVSRSELRLPAWPAQLSGLRVALLSALHVGSPYWDVVEDGRHPFVTAGVGTSIFPVRFLVPPEIALLTLR